MAYGSADTIERKKTGAYGPTVIDPATGMPIARDLGGGVQGTGQAAYDALASARGQQDYQNWDAAGRPYGNQPITTTPGAGNANARNALMQLWAFYNRKPTDPGVDVQTPLKQLIAGIRAQQNPYGSVAMPSLAGATNPMAAYMQQSGADPAAAQQMQQMLAAESAGMRQADVALQDRMGQAWKANQQAQIAQARQTAQLGAQQRAAQQQQINSDAMMEIIKLAMSNGLDLGKMGIKF